MVPSRKSTARLRIAPSISVIFYDTVGREVSVHEMTHAWKEAGLPSPNADDYFMTLTCSYVTSPNHDLQIHNDLSSFFAVVSLWA
jgi:hypothetical protein